MVSSGQGASRSAPQAILTQLSPPTAESSSESQCVGDEKAKAAYTAAPIGSCLEPKWTRHTTRPNFPLSYHHRPACEQTQRVTTNRSSHVTTKRNSHATKKRNTRLKRKVFFFKKMLKPTDKEKWTHTPRSGPAPSRTDPAASRRLTRISSQTLPASFARMGRDRDDPMPGPDRGCHETMIHFSMCVCVCHTCAAAMPISWVPFQFTLVTRHKKCVTYPPPSSGWQCGCYLHNSWFPPTTFSPTTHSSANMNDCA